MMLLAAIPFATAHIPHDVVAAVAAPRDLDPSRPWFVISNPWTLSLLYRSEDGGVSWDALGGDPIQDILVAAVTLDDHTVVLASESRLWVSRDGGDTWTPEAAPGTVVALGGGASLAIATTDGLWTGVPEGLVEVATGAFRAVAPDGTAAVDETGAIWTTDGASWTMREGPTAAVSLVRGGDALYVGASDGGVWRSSDSGWTACGALPAPKDGDEGKVMVGHLAIDPVDGSLLVTAAWRSPFRSGDQCETWTDTGWTEGDPLYDVWGGAQSQAEAFTTLYAYDGERLVGGWAGLARSTDSGATWKPAHLVAPDSCRAALIPKDWPSNPTILLGSYGAGPMISDDGGATWDTEQHGLTDMAPQQFVGPIGDDDDTILSVRWWTASTPDGTR